MTSRIMCESAYCAVLVDSTVKAPIQTSRTYNCWHLLRALLALEIVLDACGAGDDQAVGIERHPQFGASIAAR